MGANRILRTLLTCVTLAWVWVGVTQPASCASVESIVRGSLTENGRPAANIKVILVSSTGHQSDPAYTDKEGLYTFHGVNHTDRYVLRAWVSAEQPPIDFPIIFTGKGAEVWPIEIRGSSTQAQNAPVLSNEDVRKFVTDYWNAYEKGDLERLMASYAGSVDYYNNGNRDKSFILREKQTYLRYYTKQRSFRVTNMEVFDTLTPNRKSVRFDFDYSVAHNAGPKVKHSTEVWTLEKTGDRIEITNCKSDLAKA
jgi:hypothetical protein